MFQINTNCSFDIFPLNVFVRLSKQAHEMKIKNNSTFSRRSQPNRTVRISGLCSAAVLATAIAYKISNQWQEKISPGTEAPLGQFPHVVILRNSSTKEHFCSGAIVGKRSILTAAHCVDGLEIVNFEVVAGTILNNVTSDEQNVYDVAQVTVHRDYKNLANDIAMVHTANDIRLSDDVKIVKVGAKLYPTGWCRYNVNDTCAFCNLNLRILIHILHG